MNEVIKISIVLSIYGIFKEFRPSEPYLVPYMTSPPLNFTEEQVSQDIFPVSTYSTFVLLIIVFLITDFLRYKIIIIVQAICAIATYFMLIVCRGVFQMQIMQVVYGLYLAAEVGYFTYLYAKVEKDHFQEVTSYTRSAFLVGKCLSGVASQAAVYYDLTSYEGLLWITVGSEVLALIWAILLPSVDISMYFYRNNIEDGRLGPNGEAQNNISSSHDCKTVVGFLWKDFRTAFTNVYVLQWTLWWVLATCGYFMVTSYAQVLWNVIRTESHMSGVQLNGAVETTFTLIGAITSMTMGKVRLNWRRFGEPWLAVCSLVLAGLLYTMCITGSVYVAYVAYILFTVIFQTMITVSNSEVAKNINRESYGLIFGITTFFVYLLESLFTFVALQVYELKARAQFEVYAMYFGVLGLFFVLVVTARFIHTNHI